MPFFLPMVIPAAITFLVGWRLGRRAGWVILVTCALCAVALSIYAHMTLAASGLRGWVYYTPENNWPITLGISCILAAMVAAVQLLLRNWITALIVSVVLVTLFFALLIPYIIVACAGFGACI